VPTPPKVRRATRDELPAVGRTLAAAFHDDPVWRWLAPSARNWDDLAARWFAAEATAQHDGHGEVWVDDDLMGAAIWAPPGHWRSTPRETLKVAVPSMRFLRTGLVRGLRTVAALEKAHPREEHWYLAFLGTDPGAQGRGIGSALLAPVLQRADEEGRPAYLESSKKANLAFYGRQGFATSNDPVRAGGGPPLFPMWREPKAPT
jgi:GNAT superfamily N-acetyltransferase